MYDFVILQVQPIHIQYNTIRSCNALLYFQAVDNDMGKIVTSLLIDKVNDTIHYQTYSLRISNKVGFTEKAIQLKWGK